MQRLERFKWIPMLLRAWEEARERTEAERRRAAGTDVNADTGAQSAPVKPIRAPGKTTNRDAKTAGPPVRRVKRPVHRPTRPATLRKQVVRTRIRRSDYQAVLQELREAKKQLGQLDSIRHQLDELQAWFEARMAAAEKSAAKPVNRPMPFGMPMGAPAPGAPFSAMPQQSVPAAAQRPQGQASSDRIGQESERHTEAQKEGSD